MTDLSGKTLGRYHILEPLGKGGMALVYKGFDTTLERTVAIKVLRSDQFGSAVIENVFQRFKREARALTRLSHPNIVGVLDYGDHEGVPYLVMEYLPGGTLKEKMNGRRTPWREAARMLIPICRALQYAHDADVIHRDIKPSNILLTQSGEPMLTDFGIAKVLGADQTTAELTASGVGIGTPDYMAPEQAFGHDVDARADVYALGVVLYELVTGRLPYHADTPMAVLLKKSSEPLPSPRKFNPHLPEHVERMLIKALQKDPKYRYQSANEFLIVLERIAEGGTSPTDTIPGGLPSKQIHWHSVIPVGILGLLGLGVVFFAINFLRNTGTEAPTPMLTEASLAPVIPSALSNPTETSSPTLPVTPTASARLASKDGMELVYVSAGNFLRGASSEDISRLQRECPKCPMDSLNDAQPQAHIYLDAYWIDETEVTNLQFSRFVEDSGYRTTAERNPEYSYIQDLSLRDFVPAPDATWRRPRGRNSDISNKDRYPVTQISWKDAAAYCKWAGRRLPTEAEWEKAARGEDGRMFAWGNSWPEPGLLNFNFLAVDGAVPVGSYPQGASQYGALDMAGNLWEWVADYYGEDYYMNAPAFNPTGPASGKYRVMRGGSWASEYDPYLIFVTTFYRLTNYDYISSDVLGFRCATSE